MDVNTHNEIVKEEKEENIYKFQPFHTKEIIYHQDGLIPQPRSGHRIAADSTNFYSFGGYNPLRTLGNYHYVDDSYVNSFPLFQELWKYNFSLKRWTKYSNRVNFPTEVASNAVILYKNILIVFGGTGEPFGSRSSNQLYICDINNASNQMIEVKTTGNLPPPQYGQAIVHHYDCLYAIGGTTGHEYSCDVHKLNLKTLVWELLYKCKSENKQDPLGRYRHEVGFDGKRIYILSGGTATNVFTFKQIPIFDLEKKEWTRKKSIPAGGYGIPGPRKCYAASQIDTPDGVMVFIIGGHNGQMAYNDIWRLNLKTLEWTFIETASLPQSLHFHAASLTPQGRLYIFGGILNANSEPRRCNKVYSSWVCIPKLGELCWDAVLFYSPNISRYSYEKLVNMGFPRSYVRRLELHQQ